MRFICLIFALTLSHGIVAQDENRFRNFHGIKHPQNNVEFFEAEGYDIFIQPAENGLDEKGISKIKKRYSAQDALLVPDSVLNLRVLTRTEEKSGFTIYFSYYLIPKAEKKSIVVGFVRPRTRDLELERAFVKSFLSSSIPSFVYTPLNIDSIDFVGRTIQLGPSCRWMSPHNIQCPYDGQMNWAIFDNLTQAVEYRETHFAMTKDKNLLDVKEEKWVTVKFEGQETTALRTMVKVQLPKLVMGGSNLLVVYYVTAQVRNKYVTCILSHYTNDAAANQLPSLLSEVLELADESLAK